MQQLLQLIPAPPRDFLKPRAKRSSVGSYRTISPMLLRSMYLHVSRCDARVQSCYERLHGQQHPISEFHIASMQARGDGRGIRLCLNLQACKLRAVSSHLETRLHYSDVMVKQSMQAPTYEPHEGLDFSDTSEPASACQRHAFLATDRLCLRLQSCAHLHHPWVQFFLGYGVSAWLLTILIAVPMLGCH